MGAGERGRTTHDHRRRRDEAHPGAGDRSRRLGLGVGQCRLRQDLCAGAARDPPAARRCRSRRHPLPDLHRKAAAAEMASRVFAILARWTLLDDAALDAELADYHGRPPAAGERLGARRLFARALETPGGLKIQTIHAFCERLLHQFPFEANVARRLRGAGRAGGGALDRRRAAARARGGGRRCRGSARPRLRPPARRRLRPGHRAGARRHHLAPRRAGSDDRGAWLARSRPRRARRGARPRAR